MDLEEVVRRQNATIQEYADLLSAAYAKQSDYRYQILILEEELNVLKNQDSDEA